MSSAIVIITGANRGLGLELVKQIAQNPPIKPILILACARRPPTSSPIPSTDSAARIQWCTLDVSSQDSITSLARTIETEHGPTVDVLINNAGVNLDINTKHTLDRASQTIAVNFDGSNNMTNAFLPLMRRPGRKELGGYSRIVNVSSVGSKLSAIPSARLRHALRHAESMPEVLALREGYLASVKEKTEDAEGWPKGRSYSVSKALMNSSTQVLARENGDVLVNACCPGWCKTEMGALVGRPAKETRDGAKIPLKLAFGDVEGVTGRYWENPSVYDTGDGRVAEWWVEGGS